MTDLPEIAPEIRALLEEIVADPRSAIRVAPRRALRYWFDSGETARVREVSRTRIERHLIATHREALADLLFEAARIAYWKAPRFAFRPICDDGTPFDASSAEESWRRRVERRGKTLEPGTSTTDLLRQCLSGFSAGSCGELSRAALALVPSDKTRCYVALSVPWSHPRTSIALFERLAARTPSPSLRSDALSLLASRLCSIDLIHEAREAHRDSIRIAPQSPLDRFCVFVLSCCLGDEAAALEEAAELHRIVEVEDPRLLEACDLLQSWVHEKGGKTLEAGRKVSARISGHLPPAARTLCQVFET